MTAKQRATNLGRRILRLVKSGEFKLTVGYLCPSQGGCRGCALAAAAYVLGGKQRTHANEEGCLKLALPQISRKEAAQLEMGYEQWSYVDHFLGIKRRKEQFAHFDADHAHPFYKLGEKLREKKLPWSDVAGEIR